MVRIRPEVAALPPYVAGRSVEATAAEYGRAVADMVKLASNECPLPPLPGVLDAIGAAAAQVGRYPDSSGTELCGRIAAHHDVDAAGVLLGAGSSAILRDIALAVGGAGTSAVYAWPSFVIYRLASRLASARTIEVPLDADHRHDLDSLGSSAARDSSVLYVCNPNNPTGTSVPGERLRSFLTSLDAEVLVVVDEAYAEYVTDPSYTSMVPLTAHLRNLVVTRTFSKIYGLADLRVGYAVGHPETINELRKAQAPFTVSRVGQAAAMAALECQPQISDRCKENEAQRKWIEDRLAERSVSYVPSQANFVYLFSPDGAGWEHRFGRAGVIVRRLGDALRVSVGTERENALFVRALDEVISATGT